MEAIPQPARSLRFGVFELDPHAAELRKHGVRIRLQEQPFHILMALLDHPGQLVTREALRQRLWSSDTFVDFDRNLNKAMNKLRLALGDSAESPRFIETLHRRGYRFIAPVQSEETPASSSQVIHENRSWSPSQPDRRRIHVPAVQSRSAAHASVFQRWLPVSGSAALLLSSVLFLWLRPFNVKGNTPAIMPRRSVAVLGFKNLSGRSDQMWLSTAISDWLTTELSAGDQLRTIPGESVARMCIELPASDIDALGKESLLRIGTELGTDLVVVGSYASLGAQSGGEIRLDLRLEDTRTGDALEAISETGSESRLFELISHAGERFREEIGN